MGLSENECYMTKQISILLIHIPDLVLPSTIPIVFLHTPSLLEICSFYVKLSVLHDSAIFSYTYFSFVTADGCLTCSESTVVISFS